MSIKLREILYSDWLKCSKIIALEVETIRNVYSSGKTSNISVDNSDNCWTGLLQRILYKYSLIRVLTISNQDSKRLYVSWPFETDLVGTFYYTPQNHLVDFETLSLKLQRQKRKKTASINEKFLANIAILRTSRASTLQQLLTEHAEHAQTKCLYAFSHEFNKLTSQQQTTFEKTQDLKSS